MPRGELEDKVKRLGAENAQLKEAKKEANNKCQPMEKELKRMSKEIAGHEEAFRKAVEKAIHDFSHTDEG
ncbi:UNVERIFIED_CONTAM: hypothetical protein Slati_1919100 [Sesamum latifolium]|uniref:Uncharacterized protein n=1 Tax=Sesamum latifolium TaxID=2727402 RepID=A0AAW2X132_9LAMI